MRAIVVMGSTHLWTLAESSPGRLQRLAGDPWGDDGAMPLLLASAGRERHIGTAAALVAYASKRFSLSSVLPLEGRGDEAVDLLASFLKMMAEAAARRMAHETPLDWRFLLGPAVARAAAALSAACWLAGLEEAEIGRLPALPDSLGVSESAWQAFGGFDEAGIAATLVCQEPVRNGAIVLDEVRSGLVERPFEASRTSDALHSQAWRRACDAAPQHGIIAWPAEGGWSLASGAVARGRTSARAEWEALARLMHQLADDGCARRNLMESTERPESWHEGRAGLADALLPDAGTVTLEERAQACSAEGEQLPHSLVFVLEAAPGGPWDQKIVAAADTALPHESEHLLDVRRAGQRRLAFELHAVAPSTGRAYRLARGTLPLPAETRARTVLHLRVRCLPGGAVELGFNVLAWRWRETVLIDADGRLHRDAARRASLIQG